MRKLAALSLALVLLLCVCAYAEETDYTKVPEGMVVGFINYTDASDTPYNFHKGIADWCDANGVELLYAEASGDAEAMMSACDNFILQQADGSADKGFADGKHAVEVFLAEWSQITFGKDPAVARHEIAVQRIVFFLNPVEKCADAVRRNSTCFRRGKTKIFFHKFTPFQS